MMKKVSVTLGIIAVLGVVWTGGAWYTGKISEQQLQNQVNKFNEELAHLFKNTSDKMKIEDVRFHRGIFSSDMHYNLVIKSEDQNKTSTVPFVGKLYHGPIPLNQLSRLDFSPVMFVADIKLAKTENTQAWFGKKDINPLDTTLTMSYSKHIKGSIVSQVDTIIDDGALQWRFSSTYDVNQEGIGSISTEMPYAKIVLPDTMSEDGSDSIKGMTIEFTHSKSQIDLRKSPAELSKLIVGKYYGQLESIKLTGKEQGKDDYVELKDMAIWFDAELKGQFIDYGVGYKIGDFNLDHTSIGAVQLGLQLNHLDAKSMNTIFDELSKVELDTSETMPKAVDDAFKTIVKYQPQFKLEPFTITNSSGKLDGKFNVALAHDDFEGAFNGKLLQLFREFNLNLHIDKPALIEFISMALQSDGEISKEQADQLAAAELEEMLQKSREHNIFVEDSKTIKLDLDLQGETLRFNSIDLSDERVKIFILGALTLFAK